MKLSFLYGADLPTLFRLFRSQRFRFQLRHTPDVCIHFLMACFNTVAGLPERYREHSTFVRQPVFILGHWRSGTTHLHNLMNIDGTFASPNTFQTTFPHIFMAESWLAPVLDKIGPGVRLMDSMKMVMKSVQEDEIALASLGAPSSYLAIHFPNDAEKYRTYVSFRQASEEDKEEWKLKYGQFLQKFQSLIGENKSPVLKSPANTARIPMLLELYPDARFVHIHRNPYETIRSTLHLYDSWFKMVSFQGLDELKQKRDDAVLDMYEELHRAWINDKALIPQSRLLVMPFEQLKNNPLETLQQIYEFLGEELNQNTIEDYLGSIATYQQNNYDPLSAVLIAEINQRFAFVFREFGYPMINAH